jgi:hypothetical protein
MHLPIDLEPKSSVLVAGAGGGFDVVCALPIAIALREAGHTVHFANYSFTKLQEVGQTEQPLPHLFRVTEQSIPPSSGYFPEGFMAQWLSGLFAEETVVWCYNQVGVKPLTKLLANLCQELHWDTVVLLDAGVDGLFEGTEYDIGTPAVDMVSLFSFHQLSHLNRYFVSTAFGTEGRNHSVRHADALMRISQQVALEGLLGVSVLLPQSRSGKLFSAAIDYIHSKVGKDWHSNMASSLQAALKGKFGHHDLTVKTTDSPIWVSPLTLLYWFFSLESVIGLKPFRRRAVTTETLAEMNQLIAETRSRSKVLPRLDIPI